jgi:L-threonylcarbamoyladenylate synthase
MAHRTLQLACRPHPLVKQLCRQYGKPLVSTSANLSAQPPCRTADAVKQQFGPDFPVLEGLVGGRENPSEIKDAATGELIRQG